MAFAIKGGVSRAINFFFNVFKTILNHSLTVKCVLHLVWALYHVYIVAEMTLNMAK